MNKTVKLRLFLLFAVLILFSVFGAGNVETDGVESSDLQIIESSIPSATGENLDNPSFTGGSTSWTLSGATYSSGTYQDSAGSMQSYAPRKGASTAYTATQDGYDAYTSTDTVTFSCYYQRDDNGGSGDVYAEIELSTDTGTWITIWTIDADATDGSFVSTGDVDVSSYFGTGSYRLRFRAQLAGGSAPNTDIYVWIDNAHLTGSAGGTDYEKDLTETVTASDVKTTEADYDRAYSESVTVADVKTLSANFALFLAESIGAVGIISISKLTTKDMIETITASDVRETAVAYVRNRTESITVSDIIARGIGLKFSESISVVDSSEISKAIALYLFESVTASDVKTTGADYVRELSESISAIDAQSNASAYVRDLVEAITASDSIEASRAISLALFESITASDVKTIGADYVRAYVEVVTVSDVRDIVKYGAGGGIDYERDFTEVITVTDVKVNGSLFYQIFYSLNMWGYIGPTALVIVGYIASKKEKFIAFLFYIVYSLVIFSYLTLIEATPQYWWNVIILILGVILITSTLMNNR